MIRLLWHEKIEKKQNEHYRNWRDQQTVSIDGICGSCELVKKVQLNVCLDFDRVISPLTHFLFFKSCNRLIKWPDALAKVSLGGVMTLTNQINAVHIFIHII